MNRAPKNNLVCVRGVNEQNIHLDWASDKREKMFVAGFCRHCTESPELKSSDPTTVDKCFSGPSCLIICNEGRND